MASREYSSDESEEFDNNSESDFDSDTDDGEMYDNYNIHNDIEMKDNKNSHVKSNRKKRQFDSENEFDDCVSSVYEVVVAVSQIGRPATVDNIAEYLGANAIHPQTELQIQTALSSGLEEGVFELNDDKYILMESFNTKPITKSSKKLPQRQSRQRKREPF